MPTNIQTTIYSCNKKEDYGPTQAFNSGKCITVIFTLKFLLLLPNNVTFSALKFSALFLSVTPPGIKALTWCLGMVTGVPLLVCQLLKCQLPTCPPTQTFTCHLGGSISLGASIIYIGLPPTLWLYGMSLKWGNCCLPDNFLPTPEMGYLPWPLPGFLIGPVNVQFYTG